METQHSSQCSSLPTICLKCHKANFTLKSAERYAQRFNKYPPAQSQMQDLPTPHCGLSTSLALPAQAKAFPVHHNL